MSATTPYLNLYKPGGGSTGLIVPDEVVDVDRLNANSDLIDTWASDIGTKMAAQLTRGQQYRGLAANIGAVAAPLLGDTYQETDGSKWLWRHDGSNWFLAPGQVLASLVGPTVNVTAAQAIVGSVISTPTLAVGQKLRIFSHCSPYNQSTAGVGDAFLKWRNNASDVTFAAFDGSLNLRGYSSAASTVTTGPAVGATLFTTTAAAKVSVGLFNGASPSAVFGSVGNEARLWIESM